MSDKIKQGYLYDFYGELLNVHQRNVYEEFVCNDLSLGEIAAEQGISRQAVHDMIRRTTKTLEGYEEKLHLIEKFVRIRQKVKQMDVLVQEADGQDTDEILSKVSVLANQILEEL